MEIKFASTEEDHGNGARSLAVAAAGGAWPPPFSAASSNFFSVQSFVTVERDCLTLDYVITRVFISNFSMYKCPHRHRH